MIRSVCKSKVPDTASDINKWYALLVHIGIYAYVCTICMYTIYR